MFNIIKLKLQKKAISNFQIEQVYRNLFFLNFILLWKVYENVIRKKFSTILIDITNFEEF